RADGLTAGAIYGAGLEYAFNDKWSVRAEYLRFDIGSDELVAPGFNLYEAETDVDTFRLGITVKLGS
ncbi:MAG TPA: porin family protein, partial [Alphaproteobacteria bacterium]|nr:porin family protein [Alphaproteobacteria bacterium]